VEWRLLPGVRQPDRHQLAGPKKEHEMRSKLAAAALGTALLIAPAGALAATSKSASRTDAPSVAQAQATVNWQIPLAPGAAYSSARGSAQYQAQPGQSEFQAEVEHLTALAGTKVVFQVNGVKIGTRTVSPLGRAQINRNTEKGQAVPTITRGTTVTVQTPAGALIASGTF
jgi:hypothetical protein